MTISMCRNAIFSCLFTIWQIDYPDQINNLMTFSDKKKIKDSPQLHSQDQVSLQGTFGWKKLAGFHPYDHKINYKMHARKSSRKYKKFQQIELNVIYLKYAIFKCPPIVK